MGRRRSTEVERTAYHEAGHVVAMVKLGIGVKAVTIISGDSYCGSTWPGDSLSRASERDGAVILHHRDKFAGGLERKYTRAAYALMRQHWGDVVRVAVALLEHRTLPGPDVTDYIL